MRIELSVQWKMQGVSMGCFPACLAMLLSQKEFNCETWDVLELLQMPYRIEASKENNYLVAGSAFENDSLTRLLLAGNTGFELIDEFVDTPDAFLKQASRLLQKGMAFMTSIDTPAGGHAIVVYGKDDDEYLLYDPDNGVRYKRPVPVPTRTDPLREAVSEEELIRRLRQVRSGMVCLGHLEPSGPLSAVPPVSRQLLQAPGGDDNIGQDGIVMGIPALKMASEWAGNVAGELKITADFKSRRKTFSDFGSACLRALTRNLFGAIVASGIVHFNDSDRRVVYTQILEILERLYTLFIDGMGQPEGASAPDARIMEEIIHNLDRLTASFTALEQIV